MHSSAQWKTYLTQLMHAQNSQTEYFSVTHERTEGTARYWLFFVERTTWNSTTGAWNPYRKCLVVAIKPQSSTTTWINFSALAAQDAHNIAPQTPNVSFFVGDVAHFHGYKVVIEQDQQLGVEELTGYQNLDLDTSLGGWLKGLACSNDLNMIAFGN